MTAALLAAEAAGRDAPLDRAPAADGPEALAYRLGLAARLLGLACRVATPGDPWTAESFVLADASIRLDAARMLLYAGAGPLAAVAVHDVLVECTRDAIGLLGTAVAGDARAVVDAIHAQLGSDPTGAGALDAVAAALIEGGADLQELP